MGRARAGYLSRSRYSELQDRSSLCCVRVPGRIQLSGLTFDNKLMKPQRNTVFLKLTASSRPSAPPSGSPKCLRFVHWLTLCTLNIHLITYLFTYLLNPPLELTWLPREGNELFFFFELTWHDRVRPLRRWSDGAVRPYSHIARRRAVWVGLYVHVGGQAPGWLAGVQSPIADKNDMTTVSQTVDVTVCRERLSKSFIGSEEFTWTGLALQWQW